MTVGCDCDVEMVARGNKLLVFDEEKLNPKRLGLVEGGGEVEGPQLSMATAADVAEAMVAADGGRG